MEGVAWKKIIANFCLFVLDEWDVLISLQPSLPLPPSACGVGGCLSSWP